MEINIVPKLRSLMRRRQPFFCLSYDFNSRQICLHPTHAHYFAQILQHRDAGHVKRAEVYAPQVLEICGDEFMVYLVSYGDFRKGKIVMGENPLAKGLGVCLFDYVYIFVEEKSMAQQKMLIRMEELGAQGMWFYKQLMEQAYSKHFGSDENSTDFCTSLRFKESPFIGFQESPFIGFQEPPFIRLISLIIIQGLVFIRLSVGYGLSGQLYLLCSVLKQCQNRIRIGLVLGLDLEQNTPINHQTCKRKQQTYHMNKIVTRITFGFKQSVYNELDISSPNRLNSSNLTVAKSTTLKPLPAFDAKSLGFGVNDTDHMFRVHSTKGVWTDPRITPLEPISIHPFNSSLHYAVQCFEGMKAYKNSAGQIRLFRPECNIKRLQRSSKRIALPEFDGEDFLHCLKEFVKLQARWIPTISEFSLYLRPLHISMENSLGVKSPSASLLMVMGSPVGPYYPTGFKPISLSCSLGNIRSAPGGTGCFKLGGNYGQTLRYGNQVAQAGYHQVLWLYEDEVIEAGTSNIFFVFKGKNGKKQVVTPILKDLILPGVTRDSIIRLFDAKPEFTMEERVITIQEVLERNKSGDLLECFSAGTAVIVGSVNNIEHNGVDHKIAYNEQLQAGEVTFMIRKELLDIQEGRGKDHFGWSKVIN